MIPAEQQETIFKPFTEVKDLTLGDYQLGLPICSLIATKMNGSLTLDNSYTKGSWFILEPRVIKENEMGEVAALSCCIALLPSPFHLPITSSAFYTASTSSGVNGIFYLIAGRRFR